MLGQQKKNGVVFRKETFLKVSEKNQTIRKID